jgi:hypothetical protein
MMELVANLEGSEVSNWYSTRLRSSILRVAGTCPAALVQHATTNRSERMVVFLVIVSIALGPILVVFDQKASLWGL